MEMQGALVLTWGTRLILRVSRRGRVEYHSLAAVDLISYVDINLFKSLISLKRIDKLRSQAMQLENHLLL
ncbi:hypothetical protein PanWU01x14_144320 [Parasponia andersonii]|uniref:Uncharacterized protein n=1 Tax=Parasponia andersonii TaxID=3476 RepID=A0A2P5CL56_PARAD|nr:hypothetical protein PanWU01x14_144320 [Parasponia andersonii]